MWEEVTKKTDAPNEKEEPGSSEGENRIGREWMIVSSYSLNDVNGTKKVQRRVRAKQRFKAHFAFAASGCLPLIVREQKEKNANWVEIAGKKGGGENVKGSYEEGSDPPPPRKKK